jgi:glutamate racemase
MPIRRGPIGVFDSGVGGLTVVAEIRRAMPAEDILYFGDTARVPYGNKSPETVTRYSREVARFLAAKGIRFLVVACNTSSAVALDSLCAEVSVPVLGMIEPGARAAAETTGTGRVGLIGTRATVQSGAYEKAVLALNPSIQVFSQACPLFVPLVEEGWAQDPVAEEVARRYLKPLLERGVDTLILGCTHYPVLGSVLRRVAGPSVKLLSSSRCAAKALQDALAGERLPEGAGRPGGRGGLRCYVTDAGTHFREVGERILGEPLAELIPVEEERLVLA